MLKSKFTKSVSNAFNHSGRKELISTYSVLGKINGETREIVIARAYMGRSANASTVYASLWVHAGALSTSGKGSAGGYGYHKESAAFQDAITSAGIELYGDVYGVSRWCHETKREKSPAEIRKEERASFKKRAYIGGVGDSAIRKAFEAIARAAGAKGKLIIVSH